MTPNEVLKFWFEECEESQWFAKDEKFDHLVRERFSETLNQARRGELYSWRKTAEGRLAEIIVLDQFSRNIFRDQGEAFSGDLLALALAQEVVAQGIDQNLTLQQKAFVYLPYMHSESLIIHEEAVRLYSQPGLEYNLKYEFLHKEIIEKFGRYPHRNSILGRKSTPKELEYLQSGGATF